MRYLQMRANYELCEVVEPHGVPGPNGDRIEMDTRFCSFLTGDPGTIVVRLKPAGTDNGSIIFAYNPATPSPDSGDVPSYPNVSWTAPDQVVISISRISQIQRQRDTEGVTHIAYHIGTVDYPPTSSSQPIRSR